jgi:superfamily II DNA or RNA helicase
MSTYDDFLKQKDVKVKPSGFAVHPDDLHKALFPFQRAVTARAIAQGKFCNGADTGLGKSLMSLAWADMVSRKIDRPVLILAPLAVSHQFVREAEKFNIPGVRFASDSSDIVSSGYGIYTTNYEKLHRFNPAVFGGVVLDEGSILKNFDGKTSKHILESFADTPFKLSASATFAPNDIDELGTQSQFVGAMPELEMKAQFFVHDQDPVKGGTYWRLKKHAPEKFWEWLSSWCCLVRKPSDVGPYSDESYKLPGLNEQNITIDTPITGPDDVLPGLWIPSGKSSDKRHINKASIEDRCYAVGDLVNPSDKQWVVWCNTNAESEMLTKYIPDAVEIAGKHKDDYKVESITKFQRGDIRVIVTKDKIFGFGINLQNCHNTVVFPNDSYERYYQLVRRFYRFGQEQTVNVYRVFHQLEGYSTLPNLARKGNQADEMFNAMLPFQKQRFTEGLHEQTSQLQMAYNPTKQIMLPDWLMEDDQELAA